MFHPFGSEPDMMSIFLDEVDPAEVADAVIDVVARKVSGDREQEDREEVEVAECRGECGGRCYDGAFDHHCEKHKEIPGGLKPGERTVECRRVCEAGDIGRLQAGNCFVVVKVKWDSEDRDNTDDQNERIELRAESHSFDCNKNRRENERMFSTEDQTLLFEVADDFEARLARHHVPGFGISPSSLPTDNYHDQVWARDFAHAAGNYFSHVQPEAVAHSLETIFKYQRPDGMLPYRVEREYQLLKFLPRFQFLSKRAFKFFEGRLRGREERPVYENKDFGGGEDTVPVVIIAVYEFFMASDVGKEFAREHYGQLRKAAEFFIKKTDLRDGLAVIKVHNADWVDTVKRRGKLSGVNVWWAQSLRGMGEIAQALGHEADAKRYGEEFERVRASILLELYSPEGYFKAEANDKRLDTVASIFGALYLLDTKEAVRVEGSLKCRVLRPSGLVNFDPPYSRKEIFWVHRYFFSDGEYHNHFVWPWVTLQNIYVKIKIALEHPDAVCRAQYKEEALADFVQMAKIFKATGGAQEILHPHKAAVPETDRYKVPTHFMGSLAGYVGVYRKLKKLGWIAG